jgi:hypothetical protein
MNGSFNTIYQEIEATPHCIVSIQEAAPQQLPLLEDNPFLAQLFGSDVPSRFPTVGQDRVRGTILRLIDIRTAHMSFDWRLPNLACPGMYSTWFTSQSKTPTPTTTPSLPMNAISYVLPEPTLCQLRMPFGICAMRTVLRQHPILASLQSFILD